MQILKDKVNEVVYEIKYNRNYTAASALLTKHNLSFESLIKSTVKLSIDDLASLADKVISQK
ncbi:MAG: hypothetical protein WC149_05675 [Arcobacteraceae bacterium]